MGQEELFGLKDLKFLMHRDTTDETLSWAFS